MEATKKKGRGAHDASGPGGGDLAHSQDTHDSDTPCSHPPIPFGLPGSDAEIVSLAAELVPERVSPERRRRLERHGYPMPVRRVWTLTLRFDGRTSVLRLADGALWDYRRVQTRACWGLPFGPWRRTGPWWRALVREAVRVWIECPAERARAAVREAWINCPAERARRAGWGR